MLITHGTLVTMSVPNEVFADGALYVEDGRIADLGPSADLEARYPKAERLDAEGKLVLPGLICAHTHFYGAFARGMGLPGEPAANFPEILEKLWWRLDKALWPEDVRYSALVSLVDAIRHGTTTLIDHHASQGSIPGSLDEIATAVEQAGVRACLCYEVTDRDGDEAARDGIQENVRFIRLAQARQRKRDMRLAGTFGLHASLTLSDKTLNRCIDSAEPLGTGFHIHVAEDKADVSDSLRRSGLRVVERLKKRGVLAPSTIAAHCVHVDRIETELLLDTGTMVVHNPRSNMNNAVGTADLPWMLHIGIPVGLGNDGFSNNMFTEMAAAYLVHKQAKGDRDGMGSQCPHRSHLLPWTGTTVRTTGSRRSGRCHPGELRPADPPDRRQPALAHRLWRRRHWRGYDHRRRAGADAGAGAIDSGRKGDYGPGAGTGRQVMATNLNGRG
jgi:putative selenium metabolism protein SsnA